MRVGALAFVLAIFNLWQWIICLPW